ncbi:hypothetical protein EJB05_03950, partial [Eragrostis curvula]
MASALLRTSGSAFRRAISSTSGRERLAVSLPPHSPIGRLTHSGAPPPRSLEEKVDDALQQVKECDQLYVQGVMELLEQYKAALQTTADHGYFREVSDQMWGDQKQIPRWFRSGL